MFCTAIELDGLCFVSSVNQVFCVLVLLGGKKRKIKYSVVECSRISRRSKCGCNVSSVSQVFCV